MVVRFCPKIISSVRAEDDASGTSFNLTRVMVFPGADLERKRLVKVNAAWALVPDDRVSPGRPYHPASDQEYCGYRARHLRPDCGQPQSWLAREIPTGDRPNAGVTRHRRLGELVLAPSTSMVSPSVMIVPATDAVASSMSSRWLEIS